MKAIELKLVKAVHDVSKGGLAIALIEMAIAGNKGFEVDIEKVPAESGLSPLEVLFSESHGRFLISFEEKNLEKIKAIFDEFAIIGRIAEKVLIFKHKNKEAINLDLRQVKALYNSLPSLLGE